MWVAVPKPKAVLNPIDAEPVKRTDGCTYQRFVTRFGTTYAKVVEPNGFTLWMVEQQE